MIIGAHIQIQSINDKADQAFLAEVLKLGSVDAGGGFLIFGGGPAEVAIHEAGENGGHELYFMCDDIEAFASDLKSRGVSCTAPTNRGWGTMTEITLPGGGRIGVYQPHHARPEHVAVKAAGRKAPARKASRKTARKAAKKAPAKKRKAPAKKKATRGRRR